MRRPGTSTLIRSTSRANSTVAPPAARHLWQRDASGQSDSAPAVPVPLKLTVTYTGRGDRTRDLEVGFDWWAGYVHWIFSHKITRSAHRPSTERLEQYRSKPRSSLID